jgi:hypothetical protein
MTNEQIALTVLVGAEAAHAFSAFMPSYFTIKTFPRDENDIQALRSGYKPAFLFNAVLALSASALTKSLLPLVAVALASVGMVYLYEQAIGGSMSTGLRSVSAGEGL